MFHESTIGALKYYAKDNPEFNHTAEFCETVRKVWNIMNVKTPGVGRHKRDSLRVPISMENKQGVQYLRDFVQYLEMWQESGERGLTKETFLAMKQTCAALADMAEYLIERADFIYVLLGQAESDPIEKRFGWYRQLSGGNFFISVRQILEAEKKIRIQSLVKFSKFDLQQIKQLLEEKEDNQGAEVILTDWVPTEMFMDMMDMTDESPAIYYVAGYIAFSLSKKTDCSSCKVALAEKNEQPEIQFGEPECDEEKKQLQSFIEILTRGGLSTPSDMLYLTCLQAHSLYSFINDSEEEKNSMLTAQNPRQSFVLTFCEKVKDSPETQQLANSECDKGHMWSSLLPKIARTMFNIFAKNYVVTVNDDIREKSKQKRSKTPGQKSATDRKVAKLSSKSKE